MRSERLVRLLTLLMLFGSAPDAALELAGQEIASELGRRLAAEIESQLSSGA